MPGQMPGATKFARRNLRWFLAAIPTIAASVAIVAANGPGPANAILPPAPPPLNGPGGGTRRPGWTRPAPPPPPRDWASHPETAAGDSADVWKSPEWAGSAALDPLADGGFRITMPASRRWAAAVATMPADLDATPILAVTVHGISPGASWVVKLDDRPFDPSAPHDVQADPDGHNTDGRYLIDLRQLSRGAWRGHKNLEVRAFVVGKPGATVSFAKIALMPAWPPVPKAVFKIESSRRERLLRGAWELSYAPDRRRLELRETGSRYIVAIALPELTAPNDDGVKAGPVVTTENQPGRRGAEALMIRYATDDADFTARVTASSGRLVGVGTGSTTVFHWSVSEHTRKPRPLVRRQTTLECQYESYSASEKMPLRVLRSHRKSRLDPSDGQVFLPNNPVLGGSALYVQNLGGLNSFFAATQTPAAEVVGDGPEGFGFLPDESPIGPDTRTVASGACLLIADDYLALADGSLADASTTEDAARVYRGLLAQINKHITAKQAAEPLRD